MKKHAVHLGIPEHDIKVIDQGISTYAQAIKLLDVMKTNSFKSAIVVTSNYHTRRARYIFRKLFLKNQLDVIVCPTHTKRSNPSLWWKNK